MHVTVIIDKADAAGSTSLGTTKTHPEPGSKVKQRVTERAEAKEAEEKELFMAVARALFSHVPEGSQEYRVIRKHLDAQAKKYGQFVSYIGALTSLERQEQEDEAQ